MQHAFPSLPAWKYTRTAMTLHWVVATMMIGGFVIGWFMTDIPGFTPTKLRYFSWHKWIGCTVLVLAVVRLVWRTLHTAPPLPQSTTHWQRVAAEATHWMLYALMFAVGVSGYLYSSVANIQVVYLGLIPLPRIIGPDPVLRPLLRYTHIYQPITPKPGNFGMDWGKKYGCSTVAKLQIQVEDIKQ
ncbi:cytochrome b [Paraburkholderia caffeinilytica]|uniref:cytochrome b n=1 Tax=Paraburkholderia caffeinilytica TaxID=1761016 RepID=UPI003DA1762E